jgi:protein-glucosylgalactosylhydroxylysine glucosidase
MRALLLLLSLCSGALGRGAFSTESPIVSSSANNDPCATGEVPVPWKAALAASDLLFFDAAGGQVLAPHLYPSVGNGYWGTTVLNDTMHIGGVFSGRGAGWNTVAKNVRKDRAKYPTPSHRARIPSTNAFNIVSATTGESSPSATAFSVVAEAIDFRRAVFLRRTRALNGAVCVEQRWYAHQVFKGLLVHEIEVLKADVAATVRLELVNGTASTDIGFEDVPFGGRVRAQFGYISETEEPTSERVGVAVISTELQELRVRQHGVGDIFAFKTVANTTLEVPPVSGSGQQQQPSRNDVVTAAAVAFGRYAAMESRALLALHESAWEEIWKAGVSVEAAPKANNSVAVAINASLYYILTAVRDDWQYGISPGGIANNAYNGHVCFCRKHFPPSLSLSKVDGLSPLSADLPTPLW